MRGRRGAWILLTAPLAVVALGLPSCSTSKGAVGLASGCSLNSDCNSPLVCVFGLCHEACAQQRDCPTGQLCVIAPSGGDHVCDLPGEGSCADGGSCQANETCSTLGTCGSTCSASDMSNCVGGQTCDPNGACISAPEGGTGGEASAGDSGGDSTVGDGPVSDGPAVEAGPLGYVPSNIGSLSVADGGVPVEADGGASPIGADGGIDYTGAPDVTITGNCNNTCLPPPVVVVQSDQSLASLYVLDSLTVDSSAVLSVADARPVIFAVLGPVDIQGTMNFAANGDSQAPGGDTNWTGTTAPQGPGGGGNGFTGNYPQSGGGGGSFCGVGGTGGAISGTPAIGGSTYGNATLTPLLAGSAGGYAQGYQWGAGGGAVQISSGKSILVRAVGIISTGGGGSLGGGGSGGGILLEAPTITIQGNVTANGGGGGAYVVGGSANGQNAQSSNLPAAGGVVPSTMNTIGGNGSAGATPNGSPGTAGDAGIETGGGGGGAGWIRLNSSSGSATISGIVSPDLTTPCATQGTL
jgi:hypothetical protein